MQALALIGRETGALSLEYLVIWDMPNPVEPGREGIVTVGIGCFLITDCEEFSEVCAIITDGKTAGMTRIESFFMDFQG